MTRQLPPHSQTRQAASMADDLGKIGVRWDEAKASAGRVSWYYGCHSDDRVQKWGVRIGQCAEAVTWEWSRRPEGETTPWARRVGGARLCRVRTCPICQWRRSLRLQAEVIPRISALRAVQPDLVPFLVTLTVRNCDTAILKHTIREMLRAWHRLTRRIFWRGVVGSVRTVEVTPGKRGRKDDAHPHIHVFLLVSPDEAARLSKAVAWRREWQELLQLDYLPQCHVAQVKDDKGAIEALKYAVKPSVRMDLLRWLPAVALALDGIRIFATGGALSVADPDQLDEPITGCDQPSHLADCGPTVTDAIMAGGWAPDTVTKLCVTYRWHGSHYRRAVWWSRQAGQTHDLFPNGVWVPPAAPDPPPAPARPAAPMAQKQPNEGGGLG